MTPCPSAQPTQATLRLRPAAAPRQPLAAAHERAPQAPLASSAQGPAADDAADADALCPICWTPTGTRPPEDVYQSVADGQVYIREHLLKWLADHRVSPYNSRDASADIDRLWPRGARGLSPASQARLSRLDAQLWGASIICYAALGTLAIAGIGIVAATPVSDDGPPFVPASTLSLLFGLRKLAYGLLGGSLVAGLGRAGIGLYAQSCGTRTVARAHPRPTGAPEAPADR